MMYRTAVLAITAACLSLQVDAYGQVTAEDTTVLAKVGRRVVTQKEFRERCDLLSGPGRSSEQFVEARKRELVLSLVAEKALANAAEDNGMLNDSAISTALEKVRRLMAMEEMLREEVRQKVKVTKAELQTGIQRAQRRLSVAYMFCKGRKPLELASQKLRPGMGLDRMEVDSTAGVLRDTITVLWGEAESTLEETAFSTKLGSVSPVTRSSFGWFVLQVLREDRNPDVSTMDANALRSSVEEIIRLRKEERKLQDFISSAMHGVSGEPIPEGFRLLAEALRSVVKLEVPCSSCALSGKQVEAARILLAGNIHDALLVMQTRSLTIGEVLTRLYANGARFAPAESPEFEGGVFNTLRQLVLQERLESLALEKGLDDRPVVANYIEMWRSHYLAEGLRSKIGASVIITDPDVYAYANSKDPTFVVPTFDLRIATSRRLESIVSLHEALMDGAAVDTVLRYLGRLRTRDIQMQLIRGITLTEAGVYGSMAWSLSPGTWSRPIKLDTVSALVQLLRRHDPKPVVDEVWDSLNVEAREAKLRRTFDVAIAGLARRQTVTIHDNLLPGVNVSNTPESANRSLGFQGRKYSVPFVRLQTDWVELSPGF